MAILTNAQNTYSQVGIREDLANMVYRIDPEETPFQSNISTKGKCTNTLVEWQTQALAAQTTNYALEGDETAAAAATNRVRLQNRCSISKKVFTVTGTSQAVDVAGVENELDEQRLLKSIELKRDMEVTLLANNSYESGSTSSARELAGLPAYISNYDSTSYSAGYSAPAGTGATAWGLTTVAATMTLTSLNASMKAAHVDGGRPKMFMVSPASKIKFSELSMSSGSGAVQIRFNVDRVRPGALIGAVDTWQSDFGAVDVVSNVQMAYDENGSNVLNRMGFLIDPRYCEVAFLRNFQSERLAKTGDGEKEHILAEYTLKVGAPTAHAILPRISV